MKIFHSILYLLIVIFISSCNTDPIAPGTTSKIEFSNLPSLDSGYCFHLWFSYPKSRVNEIKTKSSFLHGDNEYLSVSRFTINSLGNLFYLDSKTNSDVKEGYNPNLFFDAILTIESIKDSFTTPTVRLLSGNFFGDEITGTAILKLSGDDSFGNKINNDLIDSVNQYFLDSPTSLDLSDFASGIWFANSDGDSIKKGLFLTELPYTTSNNRWKYEGWVIKEFNNQKEYFSLGKFSKNTGPDATGAGPLAGDNIVSAYQFPGEDFIKQGFKKILNDGNYSVAISLQPYDYDFNKPFVILQNSVSVIPSNLSRKTSSFLKGNKNLPTFKISINRWKTN